MHHFIMLYNLDIEASNPHLKKPSKLGQLMQIAEHVKKQWDFSIYKFKRKIIEFLEDEDGKSNDGRSSGRARSYIDECRGTTVVELHKKEGSGLGLVVSGGIDKGDRPCVSYLKPGGIAHRSDSLQVGDTIVAVNGIRTAMMRHDDIINLLKNTSGVVVLELEYELPDLPQSTFSVICKRLEITLDKDGDNFGITLRGGHDYDAVKSRPLFVTQIRTGSSADREGTLKIGDRILAINGVSVIRASLAEASNMLRHATGAVVLLVEYDVSVMEAVQNAAGPLLVEIDKAPGADLGLTLTSATCRGLRGICIETIQPASIADRCGALHVGDQILSIDETSLEHMTVAEAMQLVRSSITDQIRLEIYPIGNQTKPKVVKQHEDQPTSPKHPNHSSHYSSASEAAGGAFAGIGSMPLTSLSHQNHLQNSLQHSINESYAGCSVAPHMGSALEDFDAFIGRSTLNRKLLNGGKQDGRSTSPSISSSSSNPPPTYMSSSHPVCHTERTEVVLTADLRGFGIKLQDSPFSTDGLAEPPLIGQIDVRSPADRCGVLQEGDRILSINGQCLDNLNLDQVNQLLYEAGSRVNLLVEFDVADSVIPSNGVFLVKLAKKGGGLGITVEDPVNRQPGDSLVITRVKKGSVAQRTGTLRPGDILLAVDSLKTGACQTHEVQEALDNAGDIVRLRINREEVPLDELDLVNMVTYTVELEKKGGPLGITISGTEEMYDPILISGITEGGLADMTGALHIGDRIMAINGISLHGKPLSEAISMLQTTENSVTMKLARERDAESRSRSLQKMNEDVMIEQEGDNYSTKLDAGDTPIPSVDSALESWDSSGLDGNNLPLVPGKPPLPPKARIGSPNHNNNQNKLVNGQLRLSAKALANHNANQGNHLQPGQWEVEMHDSGSDITPTSSMDNDMWSRNLDNLDMISTSDISKMSDVASVSSFSHPNDRRSDVDRSRDPSELREGSPHSRSSLSNSAKYGAEFHLREVEEQLQNIFTPTAVELHRVILFKFGLVDDFGFCLSDGVYEKGVYISAIRPGGPADRCGAILPFDRVLQINDVNIKDLDCNQAVPLITQSGRQLELILSRNPLATESQLQIANQMIHGSDRGHASDDDDHSSIWKPMYMHKSCPKLQVETV